MVGWLTCKIYHANILSPVPSLCDPVQRQEPINLPTPKPDVEGWLSVRRVTNIFLLTRFASQNISTRVPPYVSLFLCPCATPGAHQFTSAGARDGGLGCLASMPEPEPGRVEDWWRVRLATNAPILSASIPKCCSSCMLLQRQEPVSMPAPEPEMEGWVACEACNQWRKVSVAYQERVEREDIQFVCNMLPDLDCSVISEFGVAQD
eukprot:49367-Pelagomonas_calceolata.AAC.2